MALPCGCVLNLELLPKLPPGVTHNALIKIASLHVKDYTQRIKEAGKGTNIKECQYYKSIWENISNKTEKCFQMHAMFDPVELREIREAVDSGMFDHYLELP